MKSLYLVYCVDWHLEYIYDSIIGEEKCFTIIFLL